MLDDERPFIGGRFLLVPPVVPAVLLLRGYAVRR